MKSHKQAKDVKPLSVVIHNSQQMTVFNIFNTAQGIQMYLWDGFEYHPVTYEPSQLIEVV